MDKAAIDQVLATLRQHVADPNPRDENLAVVAETVLKKGRAVPDLSEMIDRSEHDLLWWKALQGLFHVSRYPEHHSEQARERVKATVADPRFVEWRHDVVDGTRQPPPPGRTGRRPRALRDFYIVCTIHDLKRLGVGVMEACRLAAEAVHLTPEGVYRDIWLRRNRDCEAIYAGGENSPT